MKTKEKTYQEKMKKIWLYQQKNGVDIQNISRGYAEQNYFCSTDFYILSEDAKCFKLVKTTNRHLIARSRPVYINKKRIKKLGTLRKHHDVDVYASQWGSF